MAQPPTDSSPSQAVPRGRRPRRAGGPAAGGPALSKSRPPTRMLASVTQVSGPIGESAVTVTRHSGCGAAPALTQARKLPAARDRRGRRGGPVPLPPARGSRIPAVAQRHSAAQAGGRHA